MLLKFAEVHELVTLRSLENFLMPRNPPGVDRQLWCCHYHCGDVSMLCESYVRGRKCSLVSRDGSGAK